MSTKETRRVGLVTLSLLGTLVGLVTGLGAVLFRDLIGLLHNIAFEGRFVVAYDANEFTPASPFGIFIILVPVIGGMIVTYLVNNFAPEARGHGVPEVMDAIHYKEGVIRPVVALVKSLASAVSIATGAAVGREGPIIQIGSSLGSTLGQVLPIATWQRITLVAAGAGAGIAATFNTPIGGVMFAIELMLPEVSARTFLPVALATGAATFVGRYFFGLQPAFNLPANLLIDHPATLFALATYAVLGIVGGVAATLFIRGLELAEDGFALTKNAYLRHFLGMIMLGVLIYALLRSTGQYFVDGVGYATVQAIIDGHLAMPALLCVLFVAKLFATSVSLGSGASGGIFSPSLFMGATLGGAIGAMATHIQPGTDAGAVNCAIIGMAALVGGGTGATMTAVTMIFEMTRDYALVMPSIIAVALAVGMRRLLSQESIYTAKLAGRRHFVPKALHANMFLVRHASEVMETDLIKLPAAADFGAVLRELKDAHGMKHVVVIADDKILGVVRVNMALRSGVEGAYTGVRLGDIAQRNFVLARDNEAVFEVVTRMAKYKAAMALVVAGSVREHGLDVSGVISREHLGDSVAASFGSFSD